MVVDVVAVGAKRAEGGGCCCWMLLLLLSRSMGASAVSAGGEKQSRKSRDAVVPLYVDS